MSTKRQDILDSGLKLFAQYGFDTVPTSKVAEKANVGQGTIFRYFPTKDALILSLYKDLKADAARHIMKGISEEMAFEEQLFTCWNNIIEWNIKNQDAFRFTEQYANSPYATQATKEEATSYFASFFGLLEKGIKEQKIKQMPLFMIQVLIYGITNSLSKMSLYFGKKITKSDIRLSFDCFWNSIKA